jgi:hypothetical protein
MSEDPEDAIDRLIDETARDLTSVSPSSALRSRVKARTAAGRRTGWTPRAIWQPVLATAVVAVVSFVLLRPSEPDAPVPASSPPAARADAVESPPVAAVESALRSVEQRRAPRVVVRGAPTAAQNDRVGMPADPLPAIEPIAIEPMTPIGFAMIEGIPEPMPLRIDQLRVEPLVF